MRRLRGLAGIVRGRVPDTAVLATILSAESQGLDLHRGPFEAYVEQETTPQLLRWSIRFKASSLIRRSSPGLY